MARHRRHPEPTDWRARLRDPELRARALAHPNPDRPGIRPLFELFDGARSGEGRYGHGLVHTPEIEVDDDEPLPGEEEDALDPNNTHP